MKQIIRFSLLLYSFYSFGQLPEGFVYVNEIIPSLNVELKYFSEKNFIGKPIEGYKSNKLILTKQTAEALKLINKHLKNKRLSLKVYDGYRPQRAVNHFIRWAKNLNDTINKSIYYPNVNKKDLFKEEYIAAKSGHSKGSTVDLTIIDTDTGKLLDMGSIYDFFGVQSWVNYEGITEEQKANRKLLHEVMTKFGFKNYPREWWHFTLKDEPFSNSYFDFPVE
ncbi:M15 family metallopeptidase [Seonamhaeicola sediminis]|uniref:D-alanyl-D-alanine dipeptidase n=1 Tax=Seonamhaeicola sediminis TaxID=2528206 RepID=A0A562YBA9_9FLAO|nr:M15 family metallopeptidase [Seonamhaeicola sediminis]TWO31679.1 M15 family metallopeptidase [Seonamhaeicola sediminis]